jgi:hypothetical protein
MKEKVKERMLLRSTIGGDKNYERNLGDPIKRRGDDYGSNAPINESMSTQSQEDALTAAALAEYKAKKARHKAYKDQNILDDAITTDESSKIVTLSTLSSSTSSSSSSSSSSSFSSKNIAISSQSLKKGAIAPPEIPFTTSPLPGTTLGVIGAPFDSAGNAFLYDTPGIIGDPHKQRLLEGIAWEVEAVRLATEAKERIERSEKREFIRNRKTDDDVREKSESSISSSSASTSSSSASTSSFSSTMNTQQLDHVNNPRRLCVLLTRARNHLIVITHAASLYANGSNSSWGIVLRTAAGINGAIRTCALKQLLEPCIGK